MPDRLALHAALSEFARRMTQPYEVGDVLDQLAAQARVVLGVAACGVTLVDPGGTTRDVAATDERAARTEAIESTLNQGPCVACIIEGTTCVVPDLEREDRWPAYRDAVLPLGWRTVLGVPLRSGDARIGGLDVYGDEPREWDAQSLADAQLLADMATSYVVNAQALQGARTLAEQLQHALDSRVVLEQAKGVIAARLNVDVDRAFELLRRHARDNNLRLRDVARQVVTGQGPAAERS